MVTWSVLGGRWSMPLGGENVREEKQKQNWRLTWSVAEGRQSMPLGPNREASLSRFGGPFVLPCAKSKIEHDGCERNLARMEI